MSEPEPRANEPHLDTGGISRLNFGVRLGVASAFLCVASAAWGASAASKHAKRAAPVGVTFAVGKDGKALGYLAPELKRTLTAALVAAGEGAAVADTSIDGLLEEL